MALPPRLNILQGQSLVMTPKLQQAIKLLHLSNLELSEFVEQALQNNPLLERKDTGEYKFTADASQDGHSEAISTNRLEKPPSINIDTKEFVEADTASTTENSMLQWQRHSLCDFDSQNPKIIDSWSEVVSLQDHLLKQANVDLPNPIDRLIAAYMVDSLDDSGYLTVSLEDISIALGSPLRRVKNILEVVQDFDPPGIFARNLSECLGLQLKDLDRYDPAMQAFIKNLGLLAKREFGPLKQICGVDSEKLFEMIKEIKALNPKPAQIFDHTVTQTVIPDVLVDHRRDGSWFIELNTDTLPRVLINNRYYMKIQSQVLGEKDKVYIAKCYQSANWLVKALHQRAQTILKVATKIVQHQEDFIEKGVQFLRPLVLREIAETLNIHESTVSRVTNNKYLSTPRGTFELKYFFSSAPRATSSGYSPSAKSIRFQIKCLVGTEMPDNILSDDKIVKILRDDGINIARRTVAKYRKVMDIPSSVQRRRDKALYP